MSVEAPTALWSAFTARAELLGAAVMRTASEETALSLLQEAAPTFACTRSVETRYSQIAERAATEGDSKDVVAAAEFAVAETGSVAVNEPAHDRGRCFLAERLWLLVRDTDLVASLDEALQRIGSLIRGGAHHPLLMSGPSRTADIERVLTIGVHGPKALVIVVIGAS